MAGTHKHPAIYAGLMGGLAATVPIPAHAATAAASPESLVALVVPSFAVGCAAGVLASTIAGHVRDRRADAAIPEIKPAHAAASDTAASRPLPATTPRHMRTTTQQDAATPVAAQHKRTGIATHDYAVIAEEYVRQTSGSASDRRNKGVRAAIADHLNRNSMEGVPIIERADGTTGDVGTPWWDAAVGERVRKHPAEDFMERTMAQPALPEKPVAPPPAVADDLDEVAGADPAVATARAQAIRSRVAYVEQALFPENPAAERERSEHDVWQEALRAMDDRARVAAHAPLPPLATSEPLAGFHDSVGGLDTLDDPAGLEAVTSFIPFKTPAGHPEVVDQESYVDYLIKDEFSRNSSEAARKSSAEYLRVIEGGSQELPKIRSQRRRRSSGRYHGAHFAEAQEA